MPEGLTAARKVMRTLVPGQRRVHFHTESPARRRQIVTTITDTGARTRIYTSSGRRGEIDARAACLQAVVTDAAEVGAHMLVVRHSPGGVLVARFLLPFGAGCRGRRGDGALRFVAVLRGGGLGLGATQGALGRGVAALLVVITGTFLGGGSCGLLCQ